MHPIAKLACSSLQPSEKTINNVLIKNLKVKKFRAKRTV
jgi:hypothetical protein